MSGIELLRSYPMNASLESVPAPAALRHVPSAPADTTLREGILEIPGEFTLHHGGSLPGVSIAWRLVGPANAPVFARSAESPLTGACTAPRMRGSAGGVRSPGPALRIDPAHFRILSFDYLGGSGESTGPSEGKVFPSISSYDQAEALARLLDHLRNQIPASHRRRFLRRHGCAWPLASAIRSGCRG